MTQLKIDFGQWTEAGGKEVNQDACAARVPAGSELATKGVTIAIADGIGSSDVSEIASSTAVDSIITDYYSTSAAWSVKNALGKVVSATNAWLHACTNNTWARYDKDRGYVCTITTLVLKGQSAHCIHAGDTRAWHLYSGHLEQLTRDHHTAGTGTAPSLSRALGVNDAIELDYCVTSFNAGEYFLLTSDGVHEHLSEEELRSHLESGGQCRDIAHSICQQALANGSDDNVTAQVLRVEEVPGRDSDELAWANRALPLPPELKSDDRLDEFRIVREIHRSDRSSAFLAQHLYSDQYALIKIPSSEMMEDPAAMDRFITEEWIAARVSSPFVMEPFPRTTSPQYLYSAFEYIDGAPLRQWIRDHPRPSLKSVREVIGQIGLGLRAMHRQEMIHQDLRPENLLIDTHGHAKIIDFGAVDVPGLSEDRSATEMEILGTQQYSAPEYFIGTPAGERSDIYSLCAIAYEMLAGDLPYGPKAAQVTSVADLRKLRYRPIRTVRSDCPEWLDEVLAKGSHPRPEQRYQDVSEFLHALHHGESTAQRPQTRPLLEQDPVRFWQIVASALALVILIQWLFV